MARQTIAVVEASGLLTPGAVHAACVAINLQVERDFVPAWGGMATDAELVPYAVADVPRDAWPLYLNRHSTDEGALGWHTDEGGKVYGRVYAGDCIRYGISWTVDLSHEVLEMILDPDAGRTFKMADGREAALEACDAVESDDLHYLVNGVWVSDFVLPPYFDQRPYIQGVRYDYQGALSGPCPALTPGGYMEIDGKTVEKDRLDGMRGRRALMTRFRRSVRRGNGS